MIEHIEKGYRIKATPFVQNKKVIFTKKKEDGYSGSFGRLGLLNQTVPTTFRVAFDPKTIFGFAEKGCNFSDFEKFLQKEVYEEDE